MSPITEHNTHSFQKNILTSAKCQSQKKGSDEITAKKASDVDSYKT